MRITKIRIDGLVPNGVGMMAIIQGLKYLLDKAGFITEVIQVNSSSIKTGMHMCSFKVDVAKLGYNARINRFIIRHTKKGYVRTHTPTWGQREQFNHIVNDVLDRLHVQANVKSGEYVVRDYVAGRVNSWDMPESTYNHGFLSVPSVLETVPIEFAEVAIENVNVNAPWLFVDESLPVKQWHTKLESVIA